MGPSYVVTRILTSGNFYQQCATACLSRAAYKGELPAHGIRNQRGDIQQIPARDVRMRLGNPISANNSHHMGFLVRSLIQNYIQLHRNERRAAAFQGFG